MMPQTVGTPHKSEVSSMTGRPSGYSLSLVETICTRLAEGESLNRICQNEEMPTRKTVYEWVLRHPEFSDKYRRAREMQAETLADETNDIADNCTPEDWTVARLRIQTRQWAAAKLAPRKYGEQKNVEMTVTKGMIRKDPVAAASERAAKKDDWAAKHLNGKGGNGAAH